MRHQRLLSAFVLALILTTSPAWAAGRAVQPGILDQAWSWLLGFWSPDAGTAENPGASVERPAAGSGGGLEHSFGASGGGTLGDKGAGTDPNG